MRREVEVRRNPSFQRERIDGCEDADRGRRRPERQRLVLQYEPAHGRADEEAELPGRARERHVAAEKLWFRQFDDQWGVDRAVQALG